MTREAQGNLRNETEVEKHFIFTINYVSLFIHSDRVDTEFLQKINNRKISFYSSVFLLGGSEGCSTPSLVDKLSGLGICHVECGAQFSVALTCNGHVIISVLFYIAYVQV